MDVVIGLFEDRQDAEGALNRLMEVGFTPADLSLVVRNTGAGPTDPAPETKGGEGRAIGAALGATSGAAIGGFAGILVGTGLLVVPGLGPFLVAGTLLSSLATAALGAGVGAAAGGLAGALIGFGVPDATARLYAANVQENDRVLVIARTEAERAAAAAEIIRQSKALEVGLPDPGGK